MASIEKLNAVVTELKKRAYKYGANDPVVTVGYETAYAVYVHENIEMKLKGLPRIGPTDPSKGTGRVRKMSRKQQKWFWGAVVRGEIVIPGLATGRGNYWDPKGEAKFLEKPARRLSREGEIGRIVTAALAQKATLGQALVLAGLRIQRDSQEMVPVDFAVLKNSAFTVLEKGD